MNEASRLLFWTNSSYEVEYIGALQDGAKPTIEDALAWIRSDITVFGVQILKDYITVIYLRPALKDGHAYFKDSISKKLFYSNGQDEFEIDENV